MPDGCDRGHEQSGGMRREDGVHSWRLARSSMSGRGHGKAKRPCASAPRRSVPSVTPLAWMQPIAIPTPRATLMTSPPSVSEER